VTEVTRRPGSFLELSRRLLSDAFPEESTQTVLDLAGDVADRVRWELEAAAPPGAGGPAYVPTGPDRRGVPVGGHVFVSYAHADIGYVRGLVGHLRGAGVPVWFDEQIPTSRRWDQVLEERIDTCRAVVVMMMMMMMSPAAKASQWVGVEVDHARTRGRPIFPLLLDGTPLFGLGRIQHDSVVGGRLPSPDLVRQLLDLPDGAAVPDAARAAGWVMAGRRVRRGCGGM
jgi:hypothetical protein